jgi:hypothetical protein
VLAGSRTVMLNLTGITGGTLGAQAQAVLTMQDKQSAGIIQFANPTASVVEGGTARITVTRTGANLVGPITVNWSATGGSATPDVDFAPSSGTLTFGPGVANQSFDLLAMDDTQFEGTETIVLSLDTPSGGSALGNQSAMTVFVVDAEQTVAFGGSAFTAGETATSASIPIVRSGIPSGTVTVLAQTSDGTAVANQDYTAASQTVTFLPGETVKPFVVPILSKNALTRNGNRIVNLSLSSPAGTPTAPSLGALNASTLTILDFRPDLVIASVTTPSGTLTGKSVAAPSTVRNLGQVAAPAFKIGIFMASTAGGDDAKVPGAGVLVATQDVSGLAAGASATFPTSITFDDEFPAGDYYVSAVANFGLTIAEADTSNDGLSGAPSILSIKKNLTKFTGATGAFSQVSPTRAGFGPLSATCDAQGSVNLTGTFAITSQQGNSALGQANLTGTLNNAPVQYLINFTGIGDDNGNIVATLTSVVFKSLTTPLTGSGNGSLTGTLEGRTLHANVTGQFTTSTGGACVFTGTLDAVGQTSFQFRFGTGVSVGSFGFGTTPDDTGMFPLKTQGYRAVFRVFFDDNFPDPSAVKFTGPAGSGVSGVPADPQESGFDSNEAQYKLPPRSGSAPGGTWSVLYKNLPHNFTVPPFNANASLVAIFPVVTLDTSMGTPLLSRIDWVYRDRITGANLSVAPAFLASISVSVNLNNGGNSQPTKDLGPATTFWDLALDGLTLPEWSQVQAISFKYQDVIGNGYQEEYSKSFSIQLNPRLEKIYGGFNGGCIPSSPETCAVQQRLLNVFVDVPSGSVNTQPCPPQIGAQSGPAFFVQIQNHDTANGQPLPAGAVYEFPSCIDQTGTTSFNNGGGLTDIFSQRTLIDSMAVPYPPGLLVGAQYDVTVTPLSTGVPFVTEVSLETPEANPTTDFVSIPNPATPSLKPAGFTLAAAKLGQAQTISWTQPTFEVANLFINPSVYTGTGQGSLFCSVNNTPNLDPAATQATFTLPTKCNGQPVLKATVCVFFEGVNGQTSDACWFWQ